MTQLRSGNGLTFDQGAFYGGNLNFEQLIAANAAAAQAAGQPTFTDRDS